MAAPSDDDSAAPAHHALKEGSEERKFMPSVNKSIKRSLSYVWPSGLIDYLAYETRATARHFRTWLLERSKYRGKRHLRLNIGCGTNVVPGWINMDLDGPEGIFRWDCRRGLPLDDGSTDFVFAEHVFEHLDRDAGLTFLRECRRCLRVGGIARIIVPDAGRYLQLYQGGWSELAAVRPLIEENGKYRDAWLNCVYRTKMEFINEVFRQGAEHKYAYDAETLILQFRDSGFSNVVQQSFGVSAATELLLDTRARGGESLYVEGIK